MKKLLLALAFALSLKGQTVGTPTVDGIGPHSARISATASSGMTHSKVTYSTTNTCAGPSGPYRWYGGASVTALSNTVGRLKSSTLYYACIVGYLGGSTYTSVSTSFTTTAELVHPFGEPTQPQVAAIPSVPGSYSYTYTITGCTGAVSGSPSLGTAVGGIQEVWDHARALASSTNYVKVIWTGLANTTCPGTFTMRARTGGGSEYIVNVNESSTVPPEWIRFDDAYYDSSTWPTITATTSGPAINGSGIITKWRFIGINVTNDVPSSAYKTITISGGVRTVSAAHGYTVGEVIQESNTTGTVRNINCFVATTPTSTTYTIGTCYNTTGGGITTSGRTFRDSVLINSGGGGPLVNIDASAATASWIIFDRCNFYGTLSPMSVRFGVIWGGNDLYIINSQFKDIRYWSPTNPTTLAAIGAGDFGEAYHIDSSGVRHTYCNNTHKGAGGITTFVEGGAGTVVTSDILYKRNKFTWAGHLDRLGLAGGFNGDRVTCRHVHELKRGENVAYIGEQIEDTFNCGVVGNYDQMWALSARPADSYQTTSVNQIKNITIRSNKLIRSSGFIIAVGGDYDTYTPNTKPTQNIHISNNEIIDINGRYYCQIDGYVTGAFMRFGGIDTVNITHNLFLGNVGTLPQFLNLFGDSVSGLLLAGNIGLVNDYGIVNLTSSDASQSPALDETGTNYNKLTSNIKNVTTAAVTTAGDYIGKNIWIGGVDTSALSPPYTANYAQTGFTKAACLAWAFVNDTCAGAGTGGETAQQRIDSVMFQDATNGDYRLKINSPYRAKNGTSWDGKDNGVIYPLYYKDQGKVTNVKITARTSSTISVGYYVYDRSDTCYIEYGGTSTYGTGTVVADGLTGTVSRVKQLTGLITGTSYNVKVVCPTEQHLLSTSTL